MNFALPTSNPNFTTKKVYHLKCQRYRVFWESSLSVPKYIARLAKKTSSYVNIVRVFFLYLDTKTVSGSTLVLLDIYCHTMSITHPKWPFNTSLMLNLWSGTHREWLPSQLPAVTITWNRILSPACNSLIKGLRHKKLPGIFVEKTDWFSSCALHHNTRGLDVLRQGFFDRKRTSVRSICVDKRKINLRRNKVPQPDPIYDDHFNTVRVIRTGQDDSNYDNEEDEPVWITTTTNEWTSPRGF